MRGAAPRVGLHNTCGHTTCAGTPHTAYSHTLGSLADGSHEVLHAAMQHSSASSSHPLHARESSHRQQHQEEFEDDMRRMRFRQIAFGGRKGSNALMERADKLRHQIPFHGVPKWHGWIERSQVPKK